MIKSASIRHQCQPHSCLTFDMGNEWQTGPLLCSTNSNRWSEGKKKKNNSISQQKKWLALEVKRCGQGNACFFQGCIPTCWDSQSPSVHPPPHRHLICVTFYDYFFLLILLNLSAAFGTAYRTLLLATLLSREVGGITSVWCSCTSQATPWCPLLGPPSLPQL